MDMQILHTIQILPQNILTFQSKSVSMSLGEEKHSKLGQFYWNLLQKTIQIWNTVCGFKAYRNLNHILLQNIKYINSNYCKKKDYVLIKLLAHFPKYLQLI